MEKEKIKVAEYLRSLNSRVKHAETWGYMKKNSCTALDCKTLAEKLNVTPATISNLNTDSKFSLIYNIADCILENYYKFFKYEDEKALKEYPDERPIDHICVSYVIEDMIHESDIWLLN